jgi:hypothetical protein
MYIPVVKKMNYREGVLLERTLPEEGKIHVSVGDQVEPSDRLGTCKVTYEIITLGAGFRPEGGNIETPAPFHSGTLVGRLGKKRFEAPFAGTLVKKDDLYQFVSEKRDYWLLPGVWGEVADISHNKSVLLRTQTVDLHLPVTTGEIKSGEMVVFPNPSDILSVKYFTDYLKSPKGKVIYIGNNLSMELARTAAELGVEAILAGSADVNVYEYAEENGVALGLFTGFGEIATPQFIFDFINEITSRYVFFYGNKHYMQIPVPHDEERFKTKKMRSILKYVRKGLRVQVLSSSNFGDIGKVDRVSKNSIFVKLEDKDEIVETTPPNILAVE